MVPSREQLAVCVNALRATAFGISGSIREKIATCGIHATTEISRSFFVPFATVVLSSIARVQVLVFQWCAECAELHNVLAGLGGCMPSSSSCSLRWRKRHRKRARLKRSWLSNGRAKRKGKMTKRNTKKTTRKVDSKMSYLECERLSLGTTFANGTKRGSAPRYIFIFFHSCCNTRRKYH